MRSETKAGVPLAGRSYHHTLTKALPNLDEARLRPHLRSNAPFTYLAPSNLEIISPALNAKAPSVAFKPEPGDLRGIPIVGPNVAGVQPGTNPLAALIAKDERAA